VGINALRANESGNNNTAVGTNALFYNTASSNTAVGDSALLHNTGGSKNTASGYQALLNNQTGSDNTANGYGALYKNMLGLNNTAIGFQALSNSDGDENTAVGARALFNNSGGGNTAVGYRALFSNAGPLGGRGNTAVGHRALSNSTGDSNIALGQDAGSSITTADNVICIGIAGTNVSNSCFVGNIFGATSSGGSTVYVNANGRLGTKTSSRRFKDQIKPMDSASEAILALKPVSFRYRKDIDPEGTSQFGLIAEDVERVSPHLVVRDKDGKPYSVRYEAVNAMLLNEFLKEHRKVQKLEAALEAVTKRLKQQDAKIQKVSAQFEMSKPAPQVVNNNQ
jgi:hypothetical protein